jgi:transposase-like protein
MQIEREQSLRVEKLCGLEVPSTEVSRAAAELDEELEAWRSRPFGEFT